MSCFCVYRSRIHERTISLRFLGIILRVRRLKVANQFQTTFAQGKGGGVKSVGEVTVDSKEENSEHFCPNYVQEFGLCIASHLPIICKTGGKIK
jgi:hypothetical protein